MRCSAMPEAQMYLGSMEEEALRAHIEEAFQRMQAAAEVAVPGILDVLRLYGGYEEALEMTRAYFEALNPPMLITASTSSE